MSRAKLAVFAVGITAAAVVVLLAAGVFRPTPPRTPEPPRPMSVPEQRQAEARLLNETAFSHPVSVRAPDVLVLAEDGKQVKLPVGQGKVLFVNFWATWCPPCVQEMPSMLSLGAQLAAAHPDTFQMIAISGDDGWDAVRQYFAKNFAGIPNTLDVVRDPDASAARAYYCAARGYCPDVKFPETYIVDRSGRIVSMIVGPRDWSDPAARQWLEFLIQG